MVEEALCAMHPGERVVGACQRCGDFVCRLCLPGKALICARCNPSASGPSAKPDVGVALNYAFQDPRWFGKLLTGGLCMIASAVIPILPMGVLFGYGMRTAMREREQPRRELPEWDGLGDLFVLGIKYYLCQLLPGLLFMFLMALLIGGGVGLAVVLGGSGSQQGQQIAAIVGGLGMVGAIFLLVAFALVLGFFMPAIHLHHVRTGRIGAGLEFRELWRIVSQRFGDYLLLWVFHLLVQMIAVFAGEMACLVGLLITVPWMIVVQGYLVGRYAAWLDAEEGAPPL